MRKFGMMLIAVMVIAGGVAFSETTAQKKPKVDVVAFSPDAKLQAKAIDKQISIFDVATKKEIRRLNAHKSRISALQFSPDGKLLASAGFKDKFIHMWQVGNGRLTFRISGPVGIEDLQFSADGKTITAVDAKQFLRIFDAATGRLIEVKKQ